MSLGITLDAGRTACTDSIAAFLRAVDGLSEYELLGASRCHGWTRLDVVVHVIAGWQDMLSGRVSTVDAEPTVDAATYWSAFASEYAGEDPILSLMSQRRRSSFYTRPALARSQLDVGGVGAPQWFDPADADECRAWSGRDTIVRKLTTSLRTDSSSQVRGCG